MIGGTRPLRPDNSKKPFAEASLAWRGRAWLMRRTRRSCCYMMVVAGRPNSLRQGGSQPADLVMTCMSMVYGACRPGTAPRAARANGSLAGNDGTLATRTSYRPEAHKAPQKTRTGPRRAPLPRRQPHIRLSAPPAILVGARSAGGAGPSPHEDRTVGTTLACRAASKPLPPHDTPGESRTGNFTVPSFAAQYPCGHHQQDHAAVPCAGRPLPASGALPRRDAPGWRPGSATW